MKAKRKREIYSVLLVLLIIGITLGYAALSSTLNINGSSQVKNSTWDIHFANVVVNSDSVTLSAGDQVATVNSSDTTEVTFAVTLQKPGDFYEFTVDIVNAGTIPGKITLVTIDGISTYSNIVDYTVTYSNGREVQVEDILNPNFSKNIKVNVFYKEDIDENDLPTSAIDLNLTFDITFNQSKDLEVTMNSIIANLVNNNESCIVKYEGQVTDQVGQTVTANNVYFNNCADKRNVIFGGFCWQIVRTTKLVELKWFIMVNQ